MVKTLLLIAPRNFNYTEFYFTKKGLEDKGVQVTVASINTDEAISMDGKRFKPDKQLVSVNPEDYDAFIIIGGSGVPSLLDYPEVIDRLKRFNKDKKIIGAICLAPIILAKAGILKGIISTVFPADFAVSFLKKSGATYTEMHVVEDDNIITADGPNSAKEFVDKILKKLNV